MAWVDACVIHAVAMCAGTRGVQLSKMKVWLWQKQVIWGGLCNTQWLRDAIQESCLLSHAAVLHLRWCTKMHEFLMCQHVSGPLVLFSKSSNQEALFLQSFNEECSFLFLCKQTYFLNSYLESEKCKSVTVDDEGESLPPSIPVKRKWIWEWSAIEKPN